MSANFYYKKSEGIYVLYSDKEVLNVVGEEVAISYTYWIDENNESRGFINKHGNPEMVKNYHQQATSKYKELALSNTPLAQFAEDNLKNQYLIVGKFNLEDLNKCISISDYISKLHKKIKEIA